MKISTPEELAALMRWDFAPSPEQWEAIRAPLEPAVVIAGAGSGKTTLMAARVVYLVATEQVRPDEVLGLTFTTKAASQLRAKVREALLAAHLISEPGADSGHDGDDTLEPTVATYNAYAAGLLTDHGLRIGHEPDTRVLSDASRYQLGARVVERHTAEVRFLTDHPPTAIQNLLALDGAMSEHLVSPEDVLRLRPRVRAGVPPGLRGGRGRQAPQDLPRPSGQGHQRDRAPARADGPGGRLPPPQARPRPDGLLRPDRARRATRRRAARRRRAGAGAVQGRAPRRVPGHVRRPGHHAVPAVLRRPRGDGRRRPQPGDLRLAGCVGVQHPALRRHVPDSPLRARTAPSR